MRRRLLFILALLAAACMHAQTYTLRVQPDGPTFASAVITSSTVKPAADWPTYTATVNTAQTSNNLFSFQPDGPRWNATLAQLAALLANAALGAEADLGGWTPYLASDTLNQDITNAPVATTLNARFQSLIGSESVTPDYSFAFNVVDPSTQAVTYYPVSTSDGYNGMIPLPDDLSAVLEGQTAQITPYSCWTDDPNKDHHLEVVVRNTGKSFAAYQVKMCGGQLLAESAHMWDTTIAYDNQNCIGCDTTDAAGLHPFASIVKWEDVQRIIAKGPAAIAQGLPYAIRFTIPHTSVVLSSNGGQGCDVLPATHNAGAEGNYLNDPPYACMGSRIRLKAGFDVSSYSAVTQVILNTFKHHGLVVADNADYYTFQMAYNANWASTDITNIVLISFTNYEEIAVNNDPLFTAYTNDDPNGSDSAGFGNIVSNCTNPAVSSSGNCNPTWSALTFPYLRPTITSATATANGITSSSALSVTVGTRVTLTLNDTNATTRWFSNAPDLVGHSVTLTPIQSTTYTPYSLGSYGFAKGSSITVTVTGTQAAAPVLSPAPGPDGNYGGGQTITMATATAGSQIRYTLDGQTPACPGPVTPTYSGPVPITLTTTVNAVTCKNGLLQSGVTTGTYTIANSPVVLGAVNYNYYNGGNATTSLTVTANNPGAGTLNIISGALRDLTQTPVLPTITSSDGRTCSYITSKFYLATDNSGYWGNGAWSCPNAPAGVITYTATWPSPQGSYNPVLHSYVWTGAALANAVEGGTGGSGPTNGTLSCGTVVTTGTNEIVQMVGADPYADIDINAWTKISIPDSQSWYSPNVPSASSTAVTPTVTGGAFYTCVAFAIKHQ